MAPRAFPIAVLDRIRASLDNKRKGERGFLVRFERSARPAAVGAEPVRGGYLPSAARARAHRWLARLWLGGPAGVGPTAVGAEAKAVVHLPPAPGAEALWRAGRGLSHRAGRQVLPATVGAEVEIGREVPPAAHAFDGGGALLRGRRKRAGRARPSAVGAVSQALRDLLAASRA
jgi:hypothetical protein